jgi:hypothetical protein
MERPLLVSIKITGHHGEPTNVCENVKVLKALRLQLREITITERQDAVTFRARPRPTSATT